MIVNQYTPVAANTNTAATSNTIQVLKFPLNVNETAFSSVFEECGTVKKIYFLKNKDGSRKSHALVEFNHLDGVVSALQLNHSLQFGSEKAIIVGVYPMSATEKENKDLSRTKIKTKR